MDIRHKKYGHVLLRKGPKQSESFEKVLEREGDLNKGTGKGRKTL